jgi:hypothetical protein
MYVKDRQTEQFRLEQDSQLNIHISMHELPHHLLRRTEEEVALDSSNFQQWTTQTTSLLTLSFCFIPLHPTPPHSQTRQHSSWGVYLTAVTPVTYKMSEAKEIRNDFYSTLAVHNNRFIPNYAIVCSWIKGSNSRTVNNTAYFFQNLNIKYEENITGAAFLSENVPVVFLAI